MTPFFDPYIGKLYATEGLNGKRILILGDSHYCGDVNCKGICGCHGMSSYDDMDECFDLTKNVIERYRQYRKGLAKGDKWCKTFLRFERAILANTETTEEDSEYLLDRIAFSNFVQSAYHADADGNYEYEDYSKSVPYICSIIDKYMPDYIIAWGNNVWDFMPGDNWEGISENIGKYDWNGHRILMLKIHHPSRFFSYEKHIPLIKEFLKM